MQDALPASFFAGDAYVSLNPWLRLIIFLFFGLGIVWFDFRYLDEAFINVARSLEYKISPGQLERNSYS
jgi:hypothetical protein